MPRSLESKTVLLNVSILALCLSAVSFDADAMLSWKELGQSEDDGASARRGKAHAPQPTLSTTPDASIHPETELLAQKLRLILTETVQAPLSTASHGKVMNMLALASEFALSISTATGMTPSTSNSTLRPKRAWFDEEIKRVEQRLIPQEGTMAEYKDNVYLGVLRGLYAHFWHTHSSSILPESLRKTLNGFLQTTTWAQTAGSFAPRFLVASRSVEPTHDDILGRLFLALHPDRISTMKTHLDLLIESFGVLDAHGVLPSNSTTAGPLLQVFLSYSKGKIHSKETILTSWGQHFLTQLSEFYEIMLASFSPSGSPSEHASLPRKDSGYIPSPPQSSPGSLSQLDLPPFLASAEIESPRPLTRPEPLTTHVEEDFDLGFDLLEGWSLSSSTENLVFEAVPRTSPRGASPVLDPLSLPRASQNSAYPLPDSVLSRPSVDAVAMQQQVSPSLDADREFIFISGGDKKSPSITVGTEGLSFLQDPHDSIPRTPPNSPAASEMDMDDLFDNMEGHWRMSESGASLTWTDDEEEGTFVTVIKSSSTVTSPVVEPSVVGLGEENLLLAGESADFIHVAPIGAGLLEAPTPNAASLEPSQPFENTPDESFMDEFVPIDLSGRPSSLPAPLRPAAPLEATIPLAPSAHPESDEDDMEGSYMIAGCDTEEEEDDDDFDIPSVYDSDENREEDAETGFTTVVTSLAVQPSAVTPDESFIDEFVPVNLSRGPSLLPAPLLPAASLEVALPLAPSEQPDSDEYDEDDFDIPSLYDSDEDREEDAENGFESVNLRSSPAISPTVQPSEVDLEENLLLAGQSSIFIHVSPHEASASLGAPETHADLTEVAENLEPMAPYSLATTSSPSEGNIFTRTLGSLWSLVSPSAQTLTNIPPPVQTPDRDQQRNLSPLGYHETLISSQTLLPVLLTTSFEVSPPPENSEEHHTYVLLSRPINEERAIAPMHREENTHAHGSIRTPQIEPLQQEVESQSATLSTSTASEPLLERGHATRPSSDRSPLETGLEEEPIAILSQNPSEDKTSELAKDFKRSHEFDQEIQNNDDEKTPFLQKNPAHIGFLTNTSLQNSSSSGILTTPSAYTVNHDTSTRHSPFAHLEKPHFANLKEETLLPLSTLAVAGAFVAFPSSFTGGHGTSSDWFGLPIGKSSRGGSALHEGHPTATGIGAQMSALDPYQEPEMPSRQSTPRTRQTPLYLMSRTSKQSPSRKKRKNNHVRFS